MKKIILAIAVLSALPVIASAEEAATTTAKPEKHHSMQNVNPSPKEVTKEAVDEVKGQAPKHVMQNN
jgi:hypothetical protein